MIRLGCAGCGGSGDGQHGRSIGRYATTILFVKFTSFGSPSTYYPRFSYYILPSKTPAARGCPPLTPATIPAAAPHRARQRWLSSHYSFLSTPKAWNPSSQVSSPEVVPLRTSASPFPILISVGFCRIGRSGNPSLLSLSAFLLVFKRKEEIKSV